MKKKLIYQIGRLENITEKLEFKIEERQFSTYLSGLALKEYFQDKNTKYIILYPVSLLLNFSAFNKLKDISEEIYKFKKEGLKLFESSENRETFLKDPSKLYSLHPHSFLADDFVVIHSIGEYKGISFSCSFEHLVFDIFTDLFMRYIEDPYDELYLDISSGHNIYVSALLEAGRLFLTLQRLQDLCCEKLLKVFLIFSEPILPQKKGIYRIYKEHELKTKSFFFILEKPKQASFENAYAEFSKKICDLLSTDREFKRKLNRYLTNAYFFYSALKNNTPLVLYSWEYDELENVTDFLKEFTNILKDRLFENYKHTSINDFSDIKKVYFNLMLYLGMIKLFKKFGITKKDEVNLAEIKRVFTLEDNNIYKFIDLTTNVTYLEHEINYNFEHKLKDYIIKNKEDRETIEKLYSYRLLAEYIPGERKSDHIDRRNFLAHCGFERLSVEIKLKDESNKLFEEQVWLRYCEDKRSRIEEILLRS
ncbi:MAG: CRISPR-associated CARF protein Csx1 [candidate division WOR-3 bacterium]